MANISHVRSYFWFKLPLFPCFLAYYLLNSIVFLYNNYKYKKGSNTQSTYTRNKKLHNWLRNLTFVNNVDYIFVNENNILQSPTLFLINQEWKWDHFFIFSRLFLRPTSYEYACFCPVSKKQGWHYVLGVANIFYDMQHLDALMKNKYSLVTYITPENIEPQIQEIIDKNYLAVTPVTITEVKKFAGKKIIVKFGKPIKPYNLFNIDKKSIVNKIISYF